MNDSLDSPNTSDILSTPSTSSGVPAFPHPVSWGKPKGPSQQLTVANPMTGLCLNPRVWSPRTSYSSPMSRPVFHNYRDATAAAQFASSSSNDGGDSPAPASSTRALEDLLKSPQVSKCLDVLTRSPRFNHTVLPSEAGPLLDLLKTIRKDKQVKIEDSRTMLSKIEELNVDIKKKQNLVNALTSTISKLLSEIKEFDQRESEIIKKLTELVPPPLINTQQTAGIGNTSTSDNAATSTENSEPRNGPIDDVISAESTAIPNDAQTNDENLHVPEPDPLPGTSSSSTIPTTQKRPAEKSNPSSSKRPRVPQSRNQQSSQKKSCCHHYVTTNSQSNTPVQRLCRRIQNQNSPNDTPSPSSGVKASQSVLPRVKKRPPITPQAATMIHKPTSGVTKTATPVSRTVSNTSKALLPTSSSAQKKEIPEKENQHIVNVKEGPRDENPITGVNDIGEDETESGNSDLQFPRQENNNGGQDGNDDDTGILEELRKGVTIRSKVPNNFFEDDISPLSEEMLLDVQAYDSDGGSIVFEDETPLSSQTLQQRESPILHPIKDEPILESKSRHTITIEEEEGEVITADDTLIQRVEKEG